MDGTLPADCGCRACGGLLEVVLESPRLPGSYRDRPLGVWRYKELLPHHPDREPVTLQEGGTPLLEAPRLAQALGIRRLQLKFEGTNPTGSFKDRGMTCAVSWAVGEGARLLGCASTGNTAASMAAYAARAGVRGIVLLPAGKVALGKVAQAMAHGARVLEVDGSFDDAMAVIIELAAKGEVSLLNSKNPFRLEGQKTLLLEVLDQRDGAVPDRVVYPVGNAGNISAGHKALLEAREAGLITDLPRLTGAQAAGASPIAAAIGQGASAITPNANPETLATAIRIGRPVSAIKALAAIRGTDGTAVAVPDEAITDAQRALAQREGVFVEPASAASIAGLFSLAGQGSLDPGEEVVAVLTGHGLKDPSAAERLSSAPIKVKATGEAVLEGSR